MAEEETDFVCVFRVVIQMMAVLRSMTTVVVAAMVGSCLSRRGDGNDGGGEWDLGCHTMKDDEMECGDNAKSLKVLMNSSTRLLSLRTLSDDYGEIDSAAAAVVVVVAVETEKSKRRRAQMEDVPLAQALQRDRTQRMDCEVCKVMTKFHEMEEMFLRPLILNVGDCLLALGWH